MNAVKQGKRGNRNKTIMVRVTPTDHAAIQNMAKERDLTASHIVRAAIRIYLDGMKAGGLYVREGGEVVRLQALL
jgi:hypothetical protein